jgi:hypothetical protein
MLLPEPLRELDLMTQEVSSHQHRIRVIKEQGAFFTAHPPAKTGFGPCGGSHPANAGDAPHFAFLRLILPLYWKGFGSFGSQGVDNILRIAYFLGLRNT